MVREISQYLSVKDSVSRALKALGEAESEIIPTRDSFGRVAAERVVCSVDMPAFSASHRDGYAVKSRDSRGASRAKPVGLWLAGSVPLGTRPRKPLASGEAIRVATGSPIPAGADAVLQLEEAKVRKGRVILSREVRPGSFVFGAGEDVRRGKVVVEKGGVIRAQDLGMLVALGVKQVRVWRRPTVAILATGNELTNSMASGGSKTRNSHAPVFLALVSALGCEPVDLGIAPDRVEAISGRLSRGLRRADIVLMTGGTSVGKHDLAGKVVARFRPRVVCHGIRMDRGRVSGLAVVGGKGIVMMPGPIQGAVNALVLLGVPMIEKLSGRKGVLVTAGARLTRRWQARKRFPNFTKVLYLNVRRSRDGLVAEPLAGETESMSLLTDSNAFAVIPEKVTTLRAGSRVEARFLPGFSFG